MLFAAENEREMGKNSPPAAIIAVFCRFPLSFKLSSWPHTAYRMFLGYAGLRGPAVR
jgi:hypothetical protein